MTKDDIIRMARESGWLHEHDSTTGFVSEAAFKFAVLVGTQEREECLKLCRRMIEIAIAHEREECAKVCDDWPNGRDDVYLIGVAIRARGEK